MKPVKWPYHKDFAFTIVDDTDHAIVERIEPIYNVLDSLNFKTTKTVWVNPSAAGTRFEKSDTLRNPDYLKFIRSLQTKGFEIALHGISGQSSSREEIIEGLDYYKDVLLHYPRIHINHSNNLDNIHCGAQRLRFYRKYGFFKINAPASYGHDKGSIYFWGDLCKKYIKYVRGKCFDDINTLKLDPFMPYYEKRFPYVNAWFSSSNGANLELTNSILSQTNQKRLVRENGLCILYTHFGAKGFVDEKYKINHQLLENLTALAEKNGWFAPAGEILDFLSQKGIKRLSPLQELRILFNILKLTIKNNSSLNYGKNRV